MKTILNRNQVATNQVAGKKANDHTQKQWNYFTLLTQEKI